MNLEEKNDLFIHKVFNIYNILYDHLENNKQHFLYKQILWKSQICVTLNAALAKHHDYYNKTYWTEDYVYAITSILDLSKKLTAFDEESWMTDTQNWKIMYESVFRKVFAHYQELYSEIECQIAW